MSSEYDRYKVIVAGDPILGFSLCVKLVDTAVSDTKSLAEEVLATDWPDVEWTKFISVSVDGEISTLELDIELHGPWVWELYDLMDPRDYYRRFDAALLAANPRDPDSFSHLPEFIETIQANMDNVIPMMLVGDSSQGLSDEEVESIVSLGSDLDIPVKMANAETGENVEKAFRELAIDLQVDKTAGVIK